MISICTPSTNVHLKKGQMNVRNDVYFNTIFKHHFQTPFLNTILNDHYLYTDHQCTFKKGTNER